MESKVLRWIDRGAWSRSAFGASFTVSMLSTGWPLIAVISQL
jgi:hypothetical protein